MIDSLQALLQNVPPGVDPINALLYVLNRQFVIPRTRAVTISLWLLFAGSSLILILSIIGIATRYYKKVAWLFARNSDGTIRPNAALTTQFCFMIYSGFYLISLRTVFLSDKIPTNLAFIWQLVSWTPLGFAFIFITWSTILAPTTSLSFLNKNNRSTFLSTHRRSRNISYFAILTATVFQVSLIGPAYHTTKSRRNMLEAGVELMSQLTAVKIKGTGVQGLLALEPAFEFFIVQSKHLSKWYRISVGVYCSWTVLWVFLYIPSAIKLILILRQRRHQLLRSVKSLQVLDDLVTNDDLIELSKISSSQSISISISPPPSPKSPRRPRLSHQLSQHPLVIQSLIGRSPSPAPRPLSLDLGIGTLTPLASPSSSINPLLSSPITPSPSYQSSSYFPPSSPTRPIQTHQQRTSKTMVLHRSSPNNSLTRLGEIYQISDSGASASTLELRKDISGKEFAERVPRNVPGELNVSEGKTQKNIPQALTFPAVGIRSGSSIGLNGTVIGIGTALGTKLGYSRSQERLDELRLTLARTNRLLLTILIQFLLASVMSISYSIFGIVVLFGRIPRATLQNVYTSWAGWTFVGPALLGTIIFTVMSFLGPRASFIPNAPQSDSPITAAESEFVPASGSSGTITERCKGRNSGTFLGVDISTFTTTSRSHSQTPSRIDINSLHTSISSNNTRKKNKLLKKSTSVFSIHSLFTPQSSLDAASISRRGRVESMLDVSELDKIKICGSGTGEENSNNTSSGSYGSGSGGEKWDNSDLEERNFTGANGWARGSNQRWLPSDWAKEESYRKDEEMGGD